MLVAKLHLSLAIHSFQFSNHVVLHVVCDHAVTTRLFFSFRLFDRGVSKPFSNTLIVGQRVSKAFVSCPRCKGIIYSRRRKRGVASHRCITSVPFKGEKGRKREKRQLCRFVVGISCFVTYSQSSIYQLSLKALLSSSFHPFVQRDTYEKKKTKSRKISVQFVFRVYLAIFSER